MTCRSREPRLLCGLYMAHAAETRSDVAYGCCLLAFEALLDGNHEKAGWTAHSEEERAGMTLFRLSRRQLSTRTAESSKVMARTW